MPIPLIAIGIIVLAVLILLLLPFILGILKIVIVIAGLLGIIWVFNQLNLKFPTKFKNWEMFMLIIGLVVGVLTILNHTGVLAVGTEALPLSIQNDLASATLSPLNIFLGFLVIVFMLLWIYQKKK